MNGKSGSLEQVMARVQTAMQPLLEELDTQAQARRARRIREHAEHWNETQRQAQALSGRRAKFHAEHADDLRRIAEICPDYPRRLFERYLPGLPVTIERLGAERILVDTILNWKDKLSSDPCIGMRPAILGAPLEVRTGETHTLFGSGFGTTQGALGLSLDIPAGANVPLTIDAWADGYVTFTVAATAPAGVPLLTPATLTLERGDRGRGGVACSAAIATTFAPPAMFLDSSFSRSDSGFHFFGGAYSRDWTLTSPVMPPRAEPLTGIGDNGVLSDLSSSEFVVGGDDPPTKVIIDGPRVTDAREIRVTIRVKDDSMWDYTLSGSFVIVQPANDPVTPGWSVV